MHREMEVVETTLCENCKREIPTVNFTIHSVHCARNIRVCPVCKEPVPYADLKEHHETLHKLQPCKKCGDSVCGTDLEDHIRDSCAHTIKSCRYCELELPRRDLPAHENYCGVRTEQCPDCREWVMIKYRQLHVDSNHGFIRLDDDPAPEPKKEPPKNTTYKPLITKMTNTSMPSTSNGFARPSTSNLNRPNGLNNINMPRTVIRYFSSSSSSSSSSLGEGPSTDWRAQSSLTSNQNGSKAPIKRTNDQPQINTNVEMKNKVDKDLSISRGAVKKRPAPKPPTNSPPANPARDLPFYSALHRQQREERQRQEQTAYNLSVGLPPVLSPAAKLEKLRKMDALQNPDVLGSSSNEDPENRRREFKNLKPMTPQEFLERFNEMQLRRDEGDAGRNGGEGEGRRNGGEGQGNRKSGDRFSEIKSSLRELRRGLNEVTAPYNSNPNVSANANNNNNINGNEGEVHSGRASPANENVRLPCEFCDQLISAHDLVQHQTGCRPDLAQLRPRSASPAGAAACPRSPEPYDEPVIPCEFCTESLPVYLISEHQERCGREANLLYPD